MYPPRISLRMHRTVDTARGVKPQSHFRAFRDWAAQCILIARGTAQLEIAKLSRDIPRVRAHRDGSTKDRGKRMGHRGRCSLSISSVDYITGPNIGALPRDRPNCLTYTISRSLRRAGYFVR